MEASLRHFREGLTYRRTMLVSEDLMATFAKISGDIHRLHTDAGFAREQGFSQRVAYGNLLGLMVSSLVGMELNDERVMLMSQKLNFRIPVFLGDVVTLDATISAISEAVGVIELKLSFKKQDDSNVATGSCQVKLI